MKLVGLDLETTGLEWEEHRIIEIAIHSYDFATRKLEDRYVQRIDPERSIQAKAQEVHGIGYNELVGCPKFADVAPLLAHKLDADIAVIHNAGFDAPFIAAEFRAAKLPPPRFTAFCTMENGRWACPDGKYPKLMELCFALQVPYDPEEAHAADYDVDRMMQCFWKALDRGFFKPPVVVEEEALA